MGHPSLLVLGVLFGQAEAIQATVEVPPPEPESRVELSIDVGQVQTLSSLGSPGLAYSELRGTLDAEGLFSTPLSLHFDGRGRRGWNEYSEDRADLSRAYVQYGDPRESLSLALGRQVILAAAGARIDGARVGAPIFEGASAELFGGLMPHPLTGDIDPDFATAGLAYDARTSSINHSGGVVASWYQGQFDRLYLTERLYLRLSSSWSIFGHAIVDLLSPDGLFGETGVDNVDPVQSIDLTNASMNIRFRPTHFFDTSLRVAHTHTIIPRQWFQDWIEEQRAQRGIEIDGFEPVGSRRSTAVLTTNVHVTPELTPYIEGRYDRRHEDDANAIGGRIGLKADRPELGFVDIYGGMRQHFDTSDRSASLLLGTDPTALLSVELNGQVLQVQGLEQTDDSLVFYDAGASLWFNLGPLSKSLDGLRLVAQYQAFFDPDQTFQLFSGRIGYRLDG